MISQQGETTMRILFCSIKGTLTEATSSNIKILQGANKALEHYQKDGWKIIGINSEVAEIGHLEEMIAEMTNTLELFPQMQCIYICPDPEGKVLLLVSRNHCLQVGEPSAYKGHFKKPQPGMILHAIAVNDGEKEKSWYIGDRPEDEAAATNAGINFMAADIWRDRFTTGVYRI